MMISPNPAQTHQPVLKLGGQDLEGTECGGPSIFPFLSESSNQKEACDVLINYVPYL